MAKKPFKHWERDPKVLCDNPHCAEVNGIEGVVRQPIKKNVIARAQEGTKKFFCYYCGLFAKTGMNKREIKRNRSEKKRHRQEEKAGSQVMTAEIT